MNVDKLVRLFAEFLNVSWDLVNPFVQGRSYTSDESAKSDWVQANWELLVERKILPLDAYLEIYGEGADFNGVSSRITDFEAEPAFSIGVEVVHSTDVLSKEIISTRLFYFERFVSFKDGYYFEEPPFDYVLIYDRASKSQKVFSMNEVKFVVTAAEF